MNNLPSKPLTPIYWPIAVLFILSYLSQYNDICAMCIILIGIVATYYRKYFQLTVIKHPMLMAFVLITIIVMLPHLPIHSNIPSTKKLRLICFVIYDVVTSVCDIVIHIIKQIYRVLKS